MNNYIAYYDGRKVEVQADTSSAAHDKAVTLFKPPKSKKHMVHVYLVDGAVSP